MQIVFYKYINILMLVPTKIDDEEMCKSVKGGIIAGGSDQT